MNVLLESLQFKKEKNLDIVAKYGAYNIRVFGSVSRGDAHENSDIDVLVDLEPNRSLLDQIGLIQELEEFLGCKVDVAESIALHDRIRDRVLEEAIAPVHALYNGAEISLHFMYREIS